MNSAITEVPRLVRDLYKVVAELELLFAAKNKKFTPDGHLVGSLREVLAAHTYGLDLYPNSHPDHDAVSKDGREVQIKATQGNKGVALRSKPQHLIVLRMDSQKRFSMGQGIVCGMFVVADCKRMANTLWLFQH